MRRIGGAPSGKSTLLLAPVVVVTNLLKSCEGTFTRLEGANTYLVATFISLRISSTAAIASFNSSSVL